MEDILHDRCVRLGVLTIYDSQWEIICVSHQVFLALALQLESAVVTQGPSRAHLTTHPALLRDLICKCSCPGASLPRWADGVFDLGLKKKSVTCKPILLGFGFAVRNETIHSTIFLVMIMMHHTRTGSYIQQAG